MLRTQYFLVSYLATSFLGKPITTDATVLLNLIRPVISQKVYDIIISQFY